MAGVEWLHSLRSRRCCRLDRARLRGCEEPGSSKLNVVWHVLRRFSRRESLAPVYRPGTAVGQVANELVGKMIGTPGSREDNPVDDSVHLRRVSDPPGDKDIGRSGYYSNVTARGGEYGGMEFLFIDATQQPVALVTFYEGSAGPPWAAQDLVPHGASLHFKLVRKGREDAFEGVFRDRAIVLSSRTLDLARQRFNKRATVSGVARLMWRPGCQDSLRI